MMHSGVAYILPDGVVMLTRFDEGESLWITVMISGGDGGKQTATDVSLPMIEKDELVML